MDVVPDPVVASFLAGHHREVAGYRVARPQGSSSWLLIVTVGGRGWIQGEEFGLGEAALLSPRHPQAYRIAEGAAGWELRWVHFHPRPDWTTLLLWPETRPGLRRAELGADAAAVADALEAVRLHGARANDTFEERLGLIALEAALTRIRRAAAESEDRGNRRVRAATSYALRRLSEPVGPVEMAQAAGVSPSQLARLFAAEMGVSPRAFVERHRFARARQILAMTDLPVKAVALEVGFADEFYFSNRFRKALGMSPSEFRRRSRGR